MGLKLTAAPVLEPFAVTDTIIRQQVRLDIDDTSQDGVLAQFIQESREDVELICRRAMITQSWLLTLDKFPSPGLETSSANWYGPSWGVGPGPLTVIRPDGKTLYEIVLPLPPLQTVDSIKYWDQNGVQQTLDPTTYIVDNVSEPARVVPAPGVAWPSTQNRINAVDVRFTAGYGLTGASVPAAIKQWMLMRITDAFENREAVVMGIRGTVETHPYFDRLLDAHRVIAY